MQDIYGHAAIISSFAVQLQWQERSTTASTLQDYCASNGPGLRNAQWTLSLVRNF